MGEHMDENFKPPSGLETAVRAAQGVYRAAKLTPEPAGHWTADMDLERLGLARRGGRIDPALAAVFVTLRCELPEVWYRALLGRHSADRPFDRLTPEELLAWNTFCDVYCRWIDYLDFCERDVPQPQLARPVLERTMDERVDGHGDRVELRR
jgi:hypothetical protein